MPGCQRRGEALDEQAVSWQTCRKQFAAAFRAVKSEKTYKKTKEKMEKTSQSEMKDSCGEDFAEKENKSS